jgi:hypothetical protein
LRLAYAALGGGGGFLLEEISREDCRVARGLRTTRERQLVQMYGLERNRRCGLVSGGLILKLFCDGSEGTVRCRVL